VNLSLASDPPGIKLLVASTEKISPFSAPAIDGSEILLSAPSTAVLGGKTYSFDHWSDGGARAHSIHVSPALSQYTASYTTPKEGPTGKTPVTKLRKHPPKSTRSRSAKFVFGADLGGASFRCKLDAKPVQGCRSPKTYKRLKPGGHVFKVWASVGPLTDPTPETFRWKVLRPKH
jgi:hypothetical protein